MRCTRVRDRLLAGTDESSDRRHLEECRACARFAQRLAETAAALDAHHARIVPDPAFARRVVARLPQPTPLLGWAALRLLPAAVALAAVLSAWVWLGTVPPGEVVTSGPTDDLVSWVLENGEASK